MGASANYSGDICFGLFAWFIIAIILACAGSREGMWLRQETPTGRVYRVRPGGRIFMAMLGLLFIVGTPLITVSEALTPGRHNEPLPGWGWFLCALFVCESIALGLFVFWISGPSEFLLDLDRRTYRRSYGWPFPQVKTGSIDDDIKGVYVRCVYMNSQYDVGLVWKNEKRWIVLGSFNRSGKADRFAEETASELSLPQVAPPSRLKSSSDVRSGLG